MNSCTYGQEITRNWKLIICRHPTLIRLPSFPLPLSSSSLYSSNANLSALCQVLTEAWTSDILTQSSAGWNTCGESPIMSTTFTSCSVVIVLAARPNRRRRKRCDKKGFRWKTQKSHTIVVEAVAVLAFTKSLKIPKPNEGTSSREEKKTRFSMSKIYF